MAFRILMVCSGNVCRSPYAELLLAQQLAARPDFEVVSAGTIGRPGMHMTDKMIAVASRHGVPEQRALDHEASRLLEDTVESADLILGMTRDHRAAAVQLAPSALRRTFTLNEFARLADALLGGLAGKRAEPLTTPDFVARAFESRGFDPHRDPSLDDIDDPIGRSQEIYDRVGAEITAAVQTITRAVLSTVLAMSTVVTNYAVLVDTQLKVEKTECTVRFLFIPSDTSVEALIENIGSDA